MRQGENQKQGNRIAIPLQHKNYVCKSCATICVPFRRARFQTQRAWNHPYKLPKRKNMIYFVSGMELI